MDKQRRDEFWPRNWPLGTPYFKAKLINLLIDWKRGMKNFKNNCVFTWPIMECGGSYTNTMQRKAVIQ